MYAVTIFYSMYPMSLCDAFILYLLLFRYVFDHHSIFSIEVFVEKKSNLVFKLRQYHITLGHFSFVSRVYIA